MNALHTLTAVIELGAGLALLCFPSATVALLVGAPLEAAPALTVARVGGAGLLALGVACWLARGEHAKRGRKRIGRRDVALQHCLCRRSHFRRNRLWTVRRVVVAGGGSPRGDDCLVCRVAVAQSPESHAG
jgi:hypothetical protein